MLRTVCIHQPDFVPWPGFFQRLLDCDLFILLDDAQYEKNGWQNRDRIKTAHGAKWISLPVAKGPLGQLIREVKLAPVPGWQDKLLNQVRESYRRAPHFEPFFSEFEELLRAPHLHMADLNESLIRWLMGKYGIDVPLQRSSAFGVQEQKNERLIQLLKAAGATRYITGAGSRNYLDEGLFGHHGIEVLWQSWTMPLHPQQHGPWIGMLSSLDALFNIGPHLKSWVRDHGAALEERP